MLAAIVCATDLSHRSDRALERAAQLSTQHKLPLHVVHVIDPELPDTLWQAQKPEIRREIDAALGRVAAPVREEAIVAVRTGFPNVEVAAYAGALGESLIVLGAPRISKAGHLSFASFTAGRILRAAVAPVLIATTAGTEPYRRAIVGIDLSPFSARAALLAADLVPDGAVTLVHAGAADRSSAAADRAKLQAFASDLRANSSAGGALSTASVVTLEGEPPQVLRAEAVRLGADLMALGTHGRSGLARALFGSIAQEMLRHMPCDLVIAVPQA